MRQPVTSFVAALFLCVSVSSAPVKQAGAQLVVASIEVAGARRYTALEVTKLSGLELGKTVTAADLNAAIQRMAAT